MMYMIIQFNSQLCEKKSFFKHSIRFVTEFSKHNMYNVTSGDLSRGASGAMNRYLRFYFKPVGMITDKCSFHTLSYGLPIKVLMPSTQTISFLKIHTKLLQSCFKDQTDLIIAYSYSTTIAAKIFDFKHVVLLHFTMTLSLLSRYTALVRQVHHYHLIECNLFSP